MVEERFRFEHVKSTFRRIKSQVKQKVLIRENAVLFITPVLLVAFCIGIISSLDRNWELQEQIATKKLERQHLELEIESLELENQYYASEEYQELAARRLLNKKFAGETLVYLPKNSESARTKYQTLDSNSGQPTELSNFEQWMRYLFGV